MSTRFHHHIKVYVPVYQVGTTFQYSLVDGTQDQQMVASMAPDYILELTGEFDATTKDLDEDRKSTTE